MTLPRRILLASLIPPRQVRPRTQLLLLSPMASMCHPIFDAFLPCALALPIQLLKLADQIPMMWQNRFAMTRLLHTFLLVWGLLLERALELFLLSPMASMCHPIFHECTPRNPKNPPGPLK